MRDRVCRRPILQTDAEARWIAPARQAWDYTQFGLRSTDRAPLPPEPAPDETRPYPIEMLGPFELKRVNDKLTRGIVKDTVIVPAFGTVEVEFVPDRAQRGLALMHCHQQMHMESGFKTLFEVT